MSLDAFCRKADVDAMIQAALRPVHKQIIARNSTPMQSAVPTLDSPRRSVLPHGRPTRYFDDDEGAAHDDAHVISIVSEEGELPNSPASPNQGRAGPGGVDVGKDVDYRLAR